MKKPLHSNKSCNLASNPFNQLFEIKVIIHVSTLFYRKKINVPNDPRS